ncbi:ACT domain-containing protein ACR8-like [Canna indica]|uniref:ACT domain-containing protein ACR n=1 Tax=Canna indica TaxID=4628 RepID=A0AAQ3Q5T9_9LILI|nr:ACT domain-containing protein ACR8-like [Canna indica]
MLTLDSVEIDNVASPTATVVKVNRGGKRSTLLDAVQVLSDLDLIIQEARVSTDTYWVMIVFHVVDIRGRKLHDPAILSRIELALSGNVSASSTNSVATGLYGAELSGPDYPGLLSELFASLRDNGRDVVESTLWTHGGSVASVIFVKDPNGVTGVMIHSDRRLHQLLNEDGCICDYAASNQAASSSATISVENWNSRGYSIVSVRCRDRAKLLFDVICVLYDMKYDIFHAAISTEAGRADLELYIRDKHGNAISCEVERQRLSCSLQAAVERRAPQGLRLELRAVDRRGLLAEVTRVFFEHGLSVARAEIRTRGGEARDVFHVTDFDGRLPDRRAIVAVRERIGTEQLKLIDDLRPPELGNVQVAGGDSGMLTLGNRALKSVCCVGNMLMRNLHYLTKGLVRL